MTTTDRLQGLRTGLGLKAPCVVASTANLVLSSTQTIDGIAVGSNQRVLVKDQTDLKENGIYTAGPLSWSRTKDFDGSGDAIPGTAVYVDRGTAGGGKFYAINSSSTSTEVVITSYVSSDADDKIWSLLTQALIGVSSFSNDTLFPLATAAAWRSSDGLSAAPDPFGSTSVSSSAIITAGIANNAVTLAKMSTGTAGALIAYSTLSVLGEIAVGSSGHLLNSNGAGSPPTFETRKGVVQVVNTQTGAVATGTTILPIDDTIPQNTEGDEYMTLAITPADTANRLLIEVVWQGGHSTTTTTMVAALFQDTTADALVAAIASKDGSANAMSQITLSYEMAAGTVSSTTFKVRAGTSAAGTTTFNGQIAARRFGGTLISSITITEIAA